MLVQGAFSEATLDYLGRTDLTKRKRLGQYFTPEPIRRELVARLRLKVGMRVLDPGVGTGEFLLSCDAARRGLELHGWDIDPEALAVARQLVPRAALSEFDALRAAPGELFDVVVGNPPYFEVRGRPELRRKFASVIGGRANIFAMFVQAGLSLVKPGGRLGFVVPPSMNHGAYFERLRRHIAEQAEIEYLRILERSDLFEQAQQAVQLIVLRKGGNGARYQFRRETPHASGRLIFSPEPERLRRFFAGRKTLFELGYEAVTGSIVWNQHREALRRSPVRGALPLVWAHNIGDGRVALDESHKRPQYIVGNRIPGKRALRGPAIVVNRVTGSVGGGKLRAALIEEGFRFVGENHVNVIRARAGAVPAIPWRRLLGLLRAPGVRERIRALTGNTQISATELTHWLPLAGR